MTVAQDNTYERFVVSGSGPYAFSWRIFNASDLAVTAISGTTIVPLTLDTHYSVSGVDDEDGGSISFLGSYHTTYAGYTLDIRSNTPVDQLTNIRNTPRFLPEVIEGAFDYLSRQNQDARRLHSLSPQLPDNEIAPDWATLLSLSSRKGKYGFFFNATTGAPELAAGLATVALTAGNIGLALYPRTSAEVAAGVTPTEYSYQPGDIRRYGAVGNGSTDCASAIGAAITQASQSGGAPWYVPEGTFSIASSLTVPNSTKGVTGYGHGKHSIIKKGFNGDMLTLGTRGVLLDIFFDGNGANFTGRGIVVSAGTNPDGYQYARGVHIWETASYCLEFTADGVGFGSLWIGCFFKLNGNNTYCVKHPTDSGTGNRIFVGCEAPFDSLMDISNSVNTQIHGGFSGRSTAGSLWCLGFSASSAQALVCGVRLAGGGQTGTIRGTIHNISGCDIAGNLVLDTGLTSSKILSNTLGSATITDNSTATGTSANEWDSTVISYNPTWTAATANPSLGNGSLNGSYTRVGRMVTLSFRLIVGSTTTFGTGVWRFSIPFAAHTRSYIGQAYVLDSGTTLLTGILRINEGGSEQYCQLLTHNSANFASATVPITFATGDEVWGTITYDV